LFFLFQSSRHPCFMVEMDAPDDPMLCGAARCVDPDSAN
jgi:hypothetical protein